jgi:hypothetical protein
LTAVQFFGFLVAAFAGLSMGSAAWSFKSIRKLPFENWLFTSVTTTLVIVPWLTLFLYYPHPLSVIQAVGLPILIKANLFAFAWGFANVFCAIGFLRIGVALTNGVLGGLGILVGVTVPMVFKATGIFRHAKDLNSPAGLIILGGALVMLLGVALSAVAGKAREGKLPTSGMARFWSAFLIVALGGVLSAGLTFTFAYSQGPVTDAMQAQRPGAMPATLAVWAIGTLAGAVVNWAYAVSLMVKNGTLLAFLPAWRELSIPFLGGCQCCLAIVLYAQGSLMLGVMGASVGWGVYQGMQILGGQLVGFATGEWRGANPGPRRMMVLALGVLIGAALIMAYGNSRA